MKKVVLALFAAAASNGASPQEPVSAPANERTGVSFEAERWLPMGYHVPPRARYDAGMDGEVRVPSDGALPVAMLEAVHVWGAGREVSALWRAASRGQAGPALEAWVLELPLPSGFGGPDWLLFAGEPGGGRVSSAPIPLTGRWIEDEGPTIRFVDLDGDGRDEVVVRQFRHNGTVDDIDLELFFSIEADLSLRHLFTLHVASSDLDSQGEYGSVCQRLLRSPAGDLRVDVWRENPRFGVPPTSLGSLDLEREQGGDWRVRRRTLADEPRYDERLRLELPRPGPRRAR